MAGVTDVNQLNFENTNVVCFARGTMIATPDGEIAIEDLSAGQPVRTMDHGDQVIRWIGSRRINGHMLAANPHIRPVVIEKGALGNVRELLVSPQHRMLVSGWKAEVMFGEAELLVAAKDLINDTSIRPADVGEVEYFHMLFDAHEIVFANGAPAESLHPGRGGHQGPAARSDCRA